MLRQHFLGDLFHAAHGRKIQGQNIFLVRVGDTESRLIRHETVTGLSQLCRNLVGKIIDFKGVDDGTDECAIFHNGDTDGGNGIARFFRFNDIAHVCFTLFCLLKVITVCQRNTLVVAIVAVSDHRPVRIGYQHRFIVFADFCHGIGQPFAHNIHICSRGPALRIAADGNFTGNLQLRTQHFLHQIGKFGGASHGAFLGNCFKRTGCLYDGK